MRGNQLLVSGGSSSSINDPDPFGDGTGRTLLTFDDTGSGWTDLNPTPYISPNPFPRRGTANKTDFHIGTGSANANAALGSVMWDSNARFNWGPQPIPSQLGISMSWWCKSPNFVNNTANRWMMYLNSGGHMYYLADSTFRFSAANSETPWNTFYLQSSPITNLSGTEWHHFVLQLKRTGTTGTWELYLNKQLIASEPTQDWWLQGTYTTWGGRPNQTSIGGLHDQLRTFGKWLTPEEIEFLYNEGGLTS
mgnify:FL=1